LNKEKLIPILLLIGIAILFGVAGYSLVEGWSLADAFFMTIITLSTTGYGEVQPLTEGGRAFTVVLIGCGVSIMAYASTILVNEIITINLSNTRGTKRMRSRIKKLSGHTIVLGFGRMGQALCEELHAEDQPFVVIEKSDERIEILKDSGYIYISAEGSSDLTLHLAGIKEAKTLVSVIDSEADSMFSCVAAKVINPDIFIIVRAHSEENRKKMMMIGADKAVLPFASSGQNVAQSIIHPYVEHFIDLTVGEGKNRTRLKIVDIIIDEKSNLLNKTLRTCGLRENGLMIVGIRKPDSEMEFAPNPDNAFELNDTLIAISTADSYCQIQTTLGNVS
jgi:voltage-gated potassium channel